MGVIAVSVVLGDDLSGFFVSVLGDEPGHVSIDRIIYLNEEICYHLGDSGKNLMQMTTIPGQTS